MNAAAPTRNSIPATAGGLCPLDYAYAPDVFAREAAFAADALAVDFNQRAFLDRFQARWPQGSPAHASYYRRIVAGPDYSIAQVRLPEP